MDVCPFSYTTSKGELFDRLNLFLKVGNGDSKLILAFLSSGVAFKRASTANLSNTLLLYQSVSQNVFANRLV